MMSEHDEMMSLADKLSPGVKLVLQIESDSTYAKVVVRRTGNAEAMPYLKILEQRPGAKTNPLLAGLWLWQDWLDASHEISQRLENPDGSYWHAIVHRREGDFSNSKYWFAKCRNHPVREKISAALPEMLKAHSADREVQRVMSGGWDPFAFVDLAESIHETESDARLPIFVAIQRLEWRALFAHCLANATI